MIHPNEVRLTQDNIATYMELATALGANYVEALKEQCNRQGVNYAASA